MRVTIALFVTVATALVIWQSGAGGWAATGALMMGIATVTIMASGRDTAERATRVESTATLSTETMILDAITEPVLLVVDGRVRIANAAARNLLGTHVVGEDIRLAIRHPAAAERLSSGAPDGVVELVGIGSRDQRHDMNVATTTPGHRIVHLIDRTARHAVEQARVDFVANASHELRTPLAAILGFIETLSDDNAGADPAVRSRFLDVMLKEARRMQRLIDDLISLSRIEAEKYDLPDRRVSLAEVIEQVAGEVRDGAGESPAEIDVRIDQPMPEITGERAQLSQVLHNLIGNAVKYGRADTPVTVTLTSIGGMIRLSVIDQGEGIAAEHIPRLTERFYRVDSGRSRALGGTGLGLAIVKHIVERHRGRLEIVSRIGIGTTVSVLLPEASKVAVTETSPN